MYTIQNGQKGQLPRESFGFRDQRENYSMSDKHKKWLLVGGLLLLVVLAVLAWLMWRKKHNRVERFGFRFY